VVQMGFYLLQVLLSRVTVSHFSGIVNHQLFGVEEKHSSRLGESDLLVSFLQAPCNFVSATFNDSAITQHQPTATAKSPLVTSQVANK